MGKTSGCGLFRKFLFGLAVEVSCWLQLISYIAGFSSKFGVELEEGWGEYGQRLNRPYIHWIECAPGIDRYSHLKVGGLRLLRKRPPEVKRKWKALSHAQTLLPVSTSICHLSSRKLQSAITTRFHQVPALNIIRLTLYSIYRNFPIELHKDKARRQRM